MVHYMEIKSRVRSELIDITDQVAEIVRRHGIVNGLCHLSVLHTTAGITVNEGADPAVRADIIRFLDKMVPNASCFTHSEGNSDAHIKASLVGTSRTLFIEDGKLVLGTWQSIYFCEFDGPRTRKVAMKIMTDR
jgi:secondary thiamine-phosphate synthase enzyme